MHPAFSVIAFTTLSGLGYGLAFWLGLTALASPPHRIAPGGLVSALAHFAAFGLIATGLISSTLHLGNPQRAWRAFSQWRSSWLSREGIAALATFIPLVWMIYGAVFAGEVDPVAGVATALLAAFTVFCTAMIYASIKAIPAWNTRLTVFSYLLFAAGSGAMLHAFFAALGGAQGAFQLSAFAGSALLCAAWFNRHSWRAHARRPIASTPESATGLGHLGAVRLLERPHTTENYLTREMGFRIARKHADKLHAIALITGLALPVALVAGVAVLAPAASAIATFASVVFMVLGIFVERWLFFAEARHAVTNYY